MIIITNALTIGKYFEKSIFCYPNLLNLEDMLEVNLALATVFSPHAS
ncbi:MAG: hypothetical protein AAF298_10930 [Cyanobacteria bacterium P01_A01_bin.40]